MESSYCGVEKPGLSCSPHKAETVGSNPTPATFNCKLCNKELTKHQAKFCSSSCAAKINNKGVTRWSKPRYCKTCNTQLTTKRLFCDTCPKVKFEDLKWDAARKRFLLRECGHKCESCGLSEWLDQKIVLTMDHIDGNSDNSAKENLQLICWNCHALTPTFGAKNIGKFPESKRNKTIRESILKKQLLYSEVGEPIGSLYTIP